MAINEEGKRIREAILKYSFPAMLEELSTIITTMIDSKMLSVLGVSYISAVSVTYQPKMFFFAIFSALNIITSSKVSFYFGKNDKVKANEIFITSVIACIVLSIFVGLLNIFLARPLMLLCSGQEDTMEFSVRYYRIIMGGFVFNQLFLLANAALRGCGMSGLAFYSNAVSSIVNIALNYLLIEGHLGFPALGIEGAAIATVLGTVAAMIFVFAVMKHRNTFVSIHYSINNKILASMNSVKEIYTMWKEVFFENIFTRIGFIINSSITARIGSFAMAIYSICNYFLNINSSIGRGYQNASMSFIGKSLGEQSEEKMQKYSSEIRRLGVISGLITSAVIVLIARPYCSFYNSDPEFVKTGFYACLITALVSFVQIPKFVFQGLLQGLGQMKESKKAATIAVTIAQPLCCLLFIIVFDWGIYGAMLSVLVSQALWLILSRSYYFKYMNKPKEYHQP